MMAEHVLSPWGAEREDLRAAIIACELANLRWAMCGGRGPRPKVETYLRCFEVQDGRAESRRAGTEQIRARVRTWARAHNAAQRRRT